MARYLYPTPKLDVRAVVFRGRPVIRTYGDVAQTFLVDGFVAGMWRVEKGRVVLEPFEKLSRSVRREVEDEAERLEAVLAD